MPDTARLRQLLAELDSIEGQVKTELAGLGGIDPERDFAPPMTVSGVVKRLETVATKRETLQRRLAACGQVRAALAAALAKAEAEERTKAAAERRQAIAEERERALASLDRAAGPLSKARALARLAGAQRARGGEQDG